MDSTLVIYQVSGYGTVHDAVYYSITVRIYIANKAAQKIYKKHNAQVNVRHRSGSNDSAARARNGKNKI